MLLENQSLVAGGAENTIPPTKGAHPAHRSRSSQAGLPCVHGPSLLGSRMPSWSPRFPLSPAQTLPWGSAALPPLRRPLLLSWVLSFGGYSLLVLGSLVFFCNYSITCALSACYAPVEVMQRWFPSLCTESSGGGVQRGKRTEVTAGRVGTPARRVLRSWDLVCEWDPARMGGWGVGRIPWRASRKVLPALLSSPALADGLGRTGAGSYILVPCSWTLTETLGTRDGWLDPEVPGCPEA